MRAIKNTPTSQKELAMRQPKGLLKGVVKSRLITSFLLFLVLTSATAVLQVNTYAYQQNPNQKSQLESNETSVLELLSHYPQDKYSVALGLEVRETKLYSIIGYNPTIIDVSNASNPVKLGEFVYDSGIFNAITLRDNYLFLGGRKGDLEILDVSDPTNITKVGNMSGTGDVWEIVFDGDLAFLASGNKGLVIVNVSVPENPVEIGNYNTNDLFAMDVRVAGNIAFVANSNENGNALVILDISNPKAPREIGHFEDKIYKEMSGHSVALNNSQLYLGTRGYGLFILDITNITNPQKIAQHYFNTEPMGGPLNDENVMDIFIYQQYVFEAAGDWLYVLDATNLLNLKIIGVFSSHMCFGVHFDAARSILYLESRFGGIFIFKVNFQSNAEAGQKQLLIAILTPTAGLMLLVTVILLYKRKRIPPFSV